MKLEVVSIKRTPELTEKWVQETISSDPSILGLGDLVLRDRERLQPNAGRLDLLLQDLESLKRFEVEIQLGATDESHIIRTVEYWDLERRRYPQYEHAAVIVAEEITSRFLNVIQLFNGAIPLIALKMTAYKVGNEYALTFVKVLDELTFGLVDEDEPIAEPTDRHYWESRGTSKTIALTDTLLKIVHEVEPKALLKYNKHYIGLEVDGSAFNFVSFRPRKSNVLMTVRLAQSEEIDAQLQEAEFDTLPYVTRWQQYRLRLDDSPDQKQQALLLDLFRKSREEFGKAA